jgi:hypothetical protein
MVERVLEGTWEEITAHAGELAGRRVQIAVLKEDAPVSENEIDASPSLTLADWMDGFIGVVEGSGPSVAERSEEAFGEGAEAKYRSQTENHDPL